MFFTARNEVVFVGFMEMVYVAVSIRLFLLCNVVYIVDPLITKCAFAEVERFMVFAAFLPAQLFDLAGRTAQVLPYALGSLQELFVHVQ
jgi:hypothetical protein